jgi:hypothetical protein
MDPGCTCHRGYLSFPARLNRGSARGHWRSPALIHLALYGVERAPGSRRGQLRFIPCTRLSRASFQNDSRSRTVSALVFGSKISRIAYWKFSTM